METKDSNLELNQLREELNTFKSRLETQQIVNNKMMRKVMKEKVIDINRRYLGVSILCVFAIPYCFWCFYYLMHTSIWLCLYTSFFLLTALIYTLFNGKDLRNNRLLDMDLMEVGKKIAKAKKLDHDWLKIGIPILIIWLVWLFLEMYHQFSGETFTIFFLSGCIGGALGAIIGLRLHFKTQKNYQHILEQIDEMTHADK